MNKIRAFFRPARWNPLQDGIMLPSIERVDTPLLDRLVPEGPVSAQKMEYLWHEDDMFPILWQGYYKRADGTIVYGVIFDEANPR